MTPASPQPAPGVATGRAALLADARGVLASGDAARALAICDQEMRAQESDRGWLLLRAEALIGLGRGVEALAELMTVLRASPRDAEALFDVGRVLLDADEPVHAERYLLHAVRYSGGKRGYAKLLKEAHRRALMVQPQPELTQSSLPQADDDLEPRDDTGVHERALAAIAALLAFEREAGLFDSRLTSALSTTRKLLPHLVDADYPVRVRRAIITSAVLFAVLLILALAAALVMRSVRAQRRIDLVVTSADAAIASGGAEARRAAVAALRGALEADPGHTAAAMRLAWLLATQVRRDGSPPAQLDEARALLERLGEPGVAWALLAAAAVEVAAGRSPGALAAAEPFAQALVESLRGELLAQDAISRGDPAAATRLLTKALEARPRSVDLFAQAVDQQTRTNDLAQAVEWLDRATRASLTGPELALVDARLRRVRGDPAAKVAEALQAAVAEQAPASVRFEGLALAASLRAELGDPTREPPPIKDIEDAAGKDPTLTRLAARALIDEGWPDLGRGVLENAGIAPSDDLALALALAREDIQGLGQLILKTQVRDIDLVWQVAVLAARAGALELVESALARLEIFRASDCVLAAVRAWVASERGLPLPEPAIGTLATCPDFGPVVLWRGRALAASDAADDGVDRRRQLEVTRGLGLAGLAARSTWDLTHDDPWRADEGGRLLHVRSQGSPTSVALRMRAAMMIGEYLKATQLYDEASEEIRRDPTVIGLAAMARLERGYGRSSIESFVEKTAVALPKHGQAIGVAALAMARISPRRATQVWTDLEGVDPSPYVVEARVRTLAAVERYDEAKAQLDALMVPPDRIAAVDLLRAELAFARADRREYWNILKQVEKRATQVIANNPVATEARLRRAAVLESNTDRRRMLEEVEERLGDWRRLDPHAPRVRQLSNLLWRAKRRALSFPESR